MNKGTLHLVPSPLSGRSLLTADAVDLIMDLMSAPKKPLFVIEEPKEARRRWIAWGLPREAVNSFIALNRNSPPDTTSNIVDSLINGHDVFLLSDCGLPAFCD